MIDSSLSAPILPVLMFHTKQIFWLDVWPLLVGFVTIFCYQIYSRIAVAGTRSKTLVFFLSSIASMCAVFGWGDHCTLHANDSAIRLRCGPG
jgi:hypothetical protein